MAGWAAAADAQLGRVVRVDRGLASVLTEHGPVRTSIGGALLGRMAKDPTEGPCTGDWCVVREWADHRLTLERLLPRRTAVVRATAGEQSHGQVLCANLDIVAVVVALHPMPVLSKVERLVTLAWESGARPVVVLTKADMVGDADLLAEDVSDAAPGVEVLVVSSLTGEGVDALRDRLDGTADPGPDRRLRARQVLADQRARRRRGARHPGDPRGRPGSAHVRTARAGAPARRGSGDRHTWPAGRRAGRRRRRASPRRSPTSRRSRRSAASTTARTRVSRAARWPRRSPTVR